MRAAGAMLALLGFFWAGCRSLSARRERIAALRELEQALTLAYGELESRAAALPELCALLRQRSGGTARALFARLESLLPLLGEENFSALWRSAVLSCCTALARREREELLGLGEVLGRYELETQLRRLRLCAGTLRESRTAAEGAYPGERRLCLGLSAAAGALLVILFL